MAQEDASKLFVAGLPDGVTEDALRTLFTSTGSRVTELSLPRDRATGRVKGFAFVTLSTSQEAEAARTALDGSLFSGRAISVRPYSSEPPTRTARPMGGGPGGFSSGGPSSSGGGGGAGGYGGGGGSGGGAGREDASDRTAYVRNLPYDATDEEVNALFTEAGLVPKRVHLPVDAEGRKRGFGFITLSSPEEVQGAIEKLTEASVRGRRVAVSQALPKGERPPPREGGGMARPSWGPPSGPPPMMGAAGGADRARERERSHSEEENAASRARGNSGNKKRRPTEPRALSGKKKNRGGWDSGDY